jgi:hypothetical protein
MWWVSPADQGADEILLPDEVLPEQTSDGYDLGKAEKVIQFFQERQKK